MSETNEPKKKMGIGQIVCWICGVIFALAGLGQLFGGAVLGGLLMLVGGVLLLPPVLSAVGAKVNVKHVLLIVVAVVLAVVGAMLSGSSDDYESADGGESSVTEEEQGSTGGATAEEEQGSTSSAAAEESVTEDEAEAEAEVESREAETESSAVEAEAEYVFDAGSLSYLNMTRDELLAVYTEYEDLLLATDTSSYSNDEQVAFETECAEQIAEEYGITADDVKDVFIYGGEENYFATFDVTAVEMKYGETVEVKTVGGTAIVKAKITSSYSNEATIDQNYYNVCDFIRDYAGTDFDTISYWAVADMTDGSESKVISFDLTGDIITTIATGEFADNTLGDYVDDLWVLPSLLEED